MQQGTPVPFLPRHPLQLRTAGCSPRAALSIPLPWTDTHGRVWTEGQGQRAVLAEKPSLGLSKEETSRGAGVLTCGAGSSRHLSAPVCPDAGPGPPWSKDEKDGKGLCPAQNLAQLNQNGRPRPLPP